MVEELHRYETGAFGGEPGRWEQVAKLRPDLTETSLLQPTITFKRSLTLQGSARRVELHHFGWGHTRGDTIIWLPDERVVFVGDLVANGPFNIVRDGEMAAWPVYLAYIESLKPEIVCPGHGSRGGLEIVTRQREFFHRALGAKSKSRALPGVTLEQVLAEIFLPFGHRSSPIQDAAEHVIPQDADLAVLSLSAQVERVFGQLDNGRPMTLAEQSPCAVATGTTGWSEPDAARSPAGGQPMEQAGHSELQSELAVERTNAGGRADL